MDDRKSTLAGSLTGELDRRGTPVREFFEDTFPNLDGLKRNWVRPDLQVPPPDVPAHRLGRVGQAFDYYVRLYFDPDADQKIAADGWFRAAMSLARLDEPPVELPFDGQDRAALRIWLYEQQDARADPISVIRSMIAETLAGRPPAVCDHEGRRRLARCCLLLGVYEEAARVTVSREHPTMTLPLLPGWDQLAGVVADHGDLVDDLLALIQVAEDNLPGLVDPDGHRVVLNPTLGAVDTVAADADLVVDECLLDLKTTSSPGFRRDYLFQLLGYVLLDIDNALNLSAVGIYRARFGDLLTWELDELLQQLCARPVDLSALREEFRGVAGSRYTLLPASHPSRHPNAAKRALNLWAAPVFRGDSAP